MDRFYAGELGRPGSRAVLSPEETRHVRVRRVSLGEEVTLFDGAGRRARARLAGFDGKCAAFEVVETGTADPDVRPLVTVAAAIPKGPRQAVLVRACTEVGAWRIIPMVARRSVVRPEKGRTRERWARIAREAAKQSRRLHVPEVMPVARLAEVLAAAEGYGLRLIGDARGGSGSLREALRGRARLDTALLLVGPEGGFTAEEIGEAESRGFVPVRLPLPVMRVETAAPVLVAMIIFACS